MLTKLGWITAFLIAVLFFMSGLEVYLIYPITYLLLGSIVTKLNPDNTDSEGRNTIQVLANAGVAVLLLIAYLIYHNSVLISALVISFSIALSDTFSSELGKKYGSTTYNICTLKPMKRGLSGGISIIGTIAGLLGSFSISLLYYLHTSDLSTTYQVILYGFLGMLIDSIIGCTLQVKYMESGQLMEAGSKENIISGYPIIDNSMTNFLSILLTVSLYLFLI